MKLLYIEWQDSVSNATWMTTQDAIDWHNDLQYTIKQVGWVIREDKRGITIANRWKLEDDYTSEQFGNVQYIPKTWILKRKEIKL